MNFMLPALKIPLIVPFLKTDSGHMMERYYLFVVREMTVSESNNI